ncbi:hypothetical protein LCGC14_1062910 [marine sediment metagenome]|uniref:Uncharacterized protein n=1 Tax=marine sediment metagenome TaxID=412755 RepID=A0A0F9QRJ9_9ZZZZ
MEYTKGEWWVEKGDFGYTIKAEQSIVSGFDEDNDVEIAEINTCLENEEELANAHLIAQSPRMIEWIKKVTVKQKGWLYQKDLDKAKEILAQAVNR